MELLRRTMHRKALSASAPQPGTPMATTTNPISDITSATVEAATRFTKISMDSAERTMAVQLEYARGAITQATLNAKALSQAKDLNELAQLRSRIAENALENMVGYSRSLYEVG